MSRLYMLDTNMVSDLARNPRGPVADRIADVGLDNVCISIVTAAELRFGCARKGSPKLTAHVEAIIANMTVLPLDAPADIEYGQLRAELAASGKLIGPNDLFIAAHARALSAVLVTANGAEFNRVRNLTVENWLP